MPNGQKWSEFEKNFNEKVSKLNFNVSPLYEKNLHFAPFGLYSKRAPRGPSKGGGPKQNFYNISFRPRCPKKNFSPFCAANPEIIEVKVTDRQTDRQTESRNLDTVYGGM